jgi:lipoprotein-releasing system permease protein
MNDYDKNYVITDLYTVRKLNGWDDEMSSGLEVTVNDFDHVEELTQRLQFIHQEVDRNGVTYGVFSIKEMAAHTFAWLSVLDMNVVMILVLMILVSAFTVVSGLLIIMLERINMIGTLKVLGATNVSVRRIFINFSIMLVGQGLLWGNVFGLLICWLQQRFHLISLDASVYYIDSVPIQFNWWLILAINLITLLISTLVIWGSSHLISIGKPSQTIRYE